VPHLAVTLLGAALVWAAVTQADLVVRAPGHVRPVTTPVKVYNPGRGEVLSSSSGCRVLDVRARKGERVKQGDVLLCLDTWSLDKDIAKQQRTIEDGQEELRHLDRLMELLARQHQAAVAEAEWDLERTQEDVDIDKQLRELKRHHALLQLPIATNQVDRMKELRRRNAASPEELEKATERFLDVEKGLQEARVPVAEVKVKVARGKLERVQQDYPVERQKKETERLRKQAEVDAARLELARLVREREHAFLRAPTDGVVTTGDVKVGELLKPGELALEIAEESGFFFEMAIRASWASLGKYFKPSCMVEILTIGRRKDGPSPTVRESEGLHEASRRRLRRSPGPTWPSSSAW
jgi:multidrug efflux pump subunit AcrA (membrane-fusion protein)